MRDSSGAVLLVLAAAAAVSCGGKSASRHTGGAVGMAAASGAADAGGEGGAGAQSVGSAGVAPSAGGRAAVLDPANACAVAEASSRRVVHGLIFAVDRSALMSTGWSDISQALLAFFRDPHATGTAVALRFFPDDQPLPGCNAASCSVDACAAPLVPLGPLSDAPAPDDAQEALLTDAITQSMLTGSEAPVGAALAGALQAAEAQTSAELDLSVVLVTAGAGGDCSFAPEQLAELAHQNAGVATFVVTPAGSSSLAELDTIARSGATGTALRIGPPDGTSPLTAALMPIRDGDVGCALAVPAAPDGRRLDFDNGQMTVTLGAEPPFAASRVPDADRCGAELAWYFDDDQSPSSIVLCPALCAELVQSRNADVEVLFPCVSHGPVQ